MTTLVPRKSSSRKDNILTYFPSKNKTNEHTPDPDPDGSLGARNGGKAAVPRVVPSPRSASQSATSPKTATTTEASDQEVEEMWGFLIERSLLDANDTYPSQETYAKILINAATSTPVTTVAELRKIAKAVGILLAKKGRIEEEEKEREEGEMEEEARMMGEMKEEMLGSIKEAWKETERRMREREEGLHKKVEDMLRKVEEMVKAKGNEKQGRGNPITDANEKGWGDTDFPPLSSQGNSSGLQLKTNMQADWEKAREKVRHRTKARQLVLDIDKDHPLASISNVGRRDELRKALRAINALAGANVVIAEKMRNSGILIELNSEETGTWLKDPANSEAFRRELKVDKDFTK